ncbi:MAG: hypothetical protein QOI91_2619 [Solirubrobacteraceae bacterium]|jgi:uncharacterized membrane protein|nr:hypothetical protein [Solirubrobacteraceae bacterium]
MSSGEPIDRGDPLAHVRVGLSFAVGLVVLVVLLVVGDPSLAPVVGWDVAGLVFAVWLWSAIWGLDAERTARRALREDPARIVADVVLLSASVVSLVAVGLVISQAGNSHGATKSLLAGLGVFSVFVAWLVVHTVFTLHYARLYYGHPPGGIDFNERDRPRYTDFAYLAFTIGMTYQVSDTDLQTKEIRVAALRQALLSYLFGAVIVASMINLIVNL